MRITRNTIQRAVVLDTLKRLNFHSTADQIYDEIVKLYPTISRATVYRNLNQLAESGDIRKVQVPNGADCFDNRSLNHYHTQCLICGKVFDVDMEYIEDLEKSIKNPHGFEFSSHDIMFSGICLNCKA